jgi:4-hydroxybenzoate polyprenyltransferase
MIKKILHNFRVKDWLHYLGYTVLGLAITSNFSLKDWLTYLSLSVFLLAYAFSFNQYFEKKERRKYFLLPLVLSFIFFPILHELSKVIYVILILIATFYSWPKINFQAKPIISTLSNGFGYLLIFILPVYILSIRILIFSILIFLLNINAQLIHEMVDYNKDKKNKKITTTVFFGRNIIMKFFKISLLLTIFVSIIFSFLFNNLLILISTVFYSFYFLQKIEIRRINHKYRYQYKFLGTLLGIVYFISFL